MTSIDRYSSNPKYQLLTSVDRVEYGQKLEVRTYQRVYDMTWRLTRGVASFCAIVFSAGLALLSNKVVWTWQASLSGKRKQVEVIKEVFEKAVVEKKPSEIEPEVVENTLLDTPVVVVEGEPTVVETPVTESVSESVKELGSAVVSAPDIKTKKPKPTDSARYFSACINTAAYATSLVLDEDAEWNKSRAPHLFTDFKMADGSPIVLEPGDYLINMKMYNLKKPGRKANAFLEDTSGVQGGVPLPGSLIRTLKPGQELVLQYKGAPLHITILNQDPDERQWTFANMIKSTEHMLYIKHKGYSSKPVTSIYSGVKYDHPDIVAKRKQRKLEAESLKVQLIDAFKSKNLEAVYKYIPSSNTFEKAATQEVSQLIQLPYKAGYWTHPMFLFVELAGDRKAVYLTVQEDNLIIYQKRDFQIPEGATVVSNNIPDEVGCVINLKKASFSKEALLANLNHKVTFENGLLVIGA